MVRSLRVLARSATVARQLIAPEAAVTATLTSCHRLTPCIRRSTHTSSLSSTATANENPVQPISTIEASSPLSPIEGPASKPLRHHNSFGFTETELPHLVHMKLPRTVREPDVRALLTRAKLDAQINMIYHFRTGKPRDYCFLKFADANEVGAAIFTLSHFTLAGSHLQPARFGRHSALLAEPHLLAGWSPSPTSDLSSRVLREPIREPPKLLATILAEQWVSFARFKDSPEDPTEIAQAFYKRFHQFDVVGIWLGNSKYKDKCLCKILFGNPADAKAARKMYLEGSSEHKSGYAKIYRAGPDDHQKLIKYRNSLPKDLTAAEVADLLEEKYRQLHMTPEDVQRWKDYPTPESAVGCKGGKPTVEAVQPTVEAVKPTVEAVQPTVEAA